jgi:hypothetical protein
MLSCRLKLPYRSDWTCFRSNCLNRRLAVTSFERPPQTVSLAQEKTMTEKMQLSPICHRPANLCRKGFCGTYVASAKIAI